MVVHDDTRTLAISTPHSRQRVVDHIEGADPTVVAHGTNIRVLLFHGSLYPDNEASQTECAKPREE